MNKAELISAIAEKVEVQKKDVEAVVSAFTEVVAETLQEGENVRMQGFGNFEVRNRAARTGRNPQTGELLEISASKTAAFKPSKALKDSLN